MKLTKTESFVHKNMKQIISLQVNFRYVAKFRYNSENSLCSEICYSSENFAIVEKFLYNSKNFAIVAKFRYNSEIAPVSPACSRFLLKQLLHS